MEPVIIFKLVLPFLFALIIIPLVIRFFIGKLIIRRIRLKHLQKLRQDFPEKGEEREAFAVFEEFLKKKIQTPFVSSNHIRDDFRTILLIAQTAYSREKNDKLKFSFSLSDLIKCSFLLMNDLEELWKGNRRVERLSRTRISWFLRVNRIGEYYGLIYRKIPFLRVFRKGRVTGKIIRLLFIPLIGLPSIFISMGASLFSLFFTELIWRHYYSLILTKSFYYIMVLYGGRNAILEKKLESFSRDRIRTEAAEIEKLIDPENSIYRSALFEEAYLIYQQYLEKYGISPEKDLDFNGVEYRFNKKRNFMKRLLQIPVRTAGQYNPAAPKGVSDRQQLYHMFLAIAGPYSRSKNFYHRLRLVDLFDSFYMISLLAYSRILFGTFLLDNISLDFLITAKNIGDELAGEWFSTRFPRFRESYRTYKLYRKSRILYKALRRGNAAGLILSVSGPLAMESVRTVIRDYIYKRTGRMTLYCFESNHLNKKRLFEINIIKKDKDLSQS
ncbi:hypothetical protein [Spirochaeta isovalerica]|uniref:Uncharacterized protein n=1 Tax=Spirochaeta isovalerica TaxID=150 RepID=A0A841R8M4_9SPIO|nr:hypothetical protein [Spirochaeta isovalerica]MBB6479078.1 hypothetical protein [Spirochaeta isovalerica]